jgi:hypothetical protein
MDSLSKNYYPISHQSPSPVSFFYRYEFHRCAHHAFECQKPMNVSVHHRVTALSLSDICKFPVLNVTE